MFNNNSLKGARIAYFHVPLAPWQMGVRILGATCWLTILVRYRYNDLPNLLLWIGTAGLWGGSGYVGFYEKGLSVPKAAGQVFLTRDQILSIKLDGDRFVVTGPDADWGGPYSGGVFRIRGKDLPGFQEALAKFTLSRP